MTKRDRPRLVDFGAVPTNVWDNRRIPLDSLMQSHEWLRAAVDVYGQGDQTRVLIVGDTARPNSIAVLSQSGAFRGLRLAGALDIGESVEALSVNETALDDLAHSLARLGVAVDLGHYPANNGFARKLRHTQRWRGLTLTRHLSDRAMPSLELEEKWKQPLDQCSRSRRQQYRRKWRKAEAMGSVEIEINTPSADDVDVLFNRIMAVEAEGWKGRERTALLYDQKQAEFFRSFGHQMVATGCLRLCFLTIGGVDAAMTYAVVWENRFWAIKVGYNEAFSVASPGEALLVELLRHCAEQNYKTFEFCGKEAAWTRAWTDDAQDIQALRFYPWTLAGVGRLILDSVEITGRHLKRFLAARINK